MWRNVGCGQHPVRAWGALPLRKGCRRLEAADGFPRELGAQGCAANVRGICWGGGWLGPAPAVQLPPMARTF